MQTPKASQRSTLGKDQVLYVLLSGVGNSIQTILSQGGCGGISIALDEERRLIVVENCSPFVVHADAKPSIGGQLSAETLGVATNDLDFFRALSRSGGFFCFVTRDRYVFRFLLQESRALQLVPQACFSTAPKLLGRRRRWT